MDLKTVVRRHSGRDAAKADQLKDALELITTELQRSSGSQDAAFDALHQLLDQTRRQQDTVLDQVRRDRMQQELSSLPGVTVSWDDHDGAREGAR
ncbi:hypothetical protein [Nesterenkonia sp. PF2B19]|uniref:hypothetical protein n=1 Tax=Nesterenkonia sp. PF2B19 TaxID=1881858 RepID=UPI000A19F4BC|nr:hypothetical protein [Nesterenkonia sp. PF2B19]OSM42178.1 hypothetical protein BCY76_015980 [Nesterenkonia sp. PF2B19]